MNKDQLITRKKILTDVHAWCFENDSKILSPLQLVCVTRERVAILHAMDWLRFDSDKDRHTLLEYELPKHLQLKVNKVLEIIEQTAWTRGEYIFDDVTRTYKRQPDYKWMNQ